MTFITITYKGDDARKAIDRYRREHPDFKGNIIAVPDGKTDKGTVIELPVDVPEFEIYE